MAIQSYSTPGAYTFDLPLSTGITIRIAGAAGGTGGTDGGPPGVVGGSSGRGRYGVFVLPNNTSGLLSIYVGGAGGNGGNSGTTAFNGGAGGTGASYGGGGQEDSPSGSSGGGAGGGGASAVYISGILLCLAGAGGGGGGGTSGATSNTGGVRTNGQDASTFSGSTAAPGTILDAYGSVTGTGGDGGGAGGGGGGYPAGNRGTFPGNDGVHPAEGGFGGGSFYRSDLTTLSSQSTYTSSLNGYVEIEYTKVSPSTPAVTVGKAGPYYSSGPISFSSLRSNFRAQTRRQSSSGSETFGTDTAPIKASDLLRNTTTTNTNPIVPDCTENRSSGPLGTGIPSSASNWKTSFFRNSIKYYYVTLPSSDNVVNFNISSQNWNSNLDKNINKFMFIEGTCGSNSRTSSSATFNATAYNLTLDVYGSILGASGRGGGTPNGFNISGANGGTGLSVSSSGGNNIIVNVKNGSRIYGGGGGGEKGSDGTNGTGGRCSSEYTHQYCAGSPNSNCPSGGSYNGTRRPGCCRSTMRGNCVESVYQNSCIIYTNTPAGVGGLGGSGGNGQGYDLSQSNGAPGTSATCGGGCGSTCGTNGEPGGNGGTWGSNGGNTSNIGEGGRGGRAISGSGYLVSGTINSDTVKGFYIP